MKKLKMMLLLLIMFLVSGCMYAEVDIKINKNDTGEINYVYAIQETFLKSSGINIDLSYKNAQISNHEFEKNGHNYIGKKIKIKFSSLEDLNGILNQINSDFKNINLYTPSISLIRENNKVRIMFDSNPEIQGIIDSYVDYIDYKITFKINGKVIKHNASNNDEKQGYYEWDFTKVLTEGLELEYKTTKLNYLLLGFVILFIVVLVFFLIKRKRETKKRINLIKKKEEEIEILDFEI